MTDYASSWAEWQGRLDNSPLPPRTAVWVARHGTVHERRELAMEFRLPIDAILVLAEDEDQTVIDFLAGNYAVPSDVLAKLVSSGRVSARDVQHNLNAPIEQKLDAPLESLAAYAITMFLDAVLADDHERAQLWKAQDSPTKRKRTLGELWSTIRSV